MGRPRKPLTEQRGNLTVVTMQAKKSEEESVTVGKNQLKQPPTCLTDDVAKKEWRRIIKELEKVSLVGNLDRNNLIGYCNAFSNYVKTTEELKEQDFTVERQTRTGIILVRNPLIDIQRMYADEMRKFASACGLTIDARLKAAAVKADKTKTDIERKFGNI